MESSTHIVCPHCAVTNRLPAERLRDNPVCGKCGKALFGNKPTNLTVAGFERHLARDGIPLVVDFWAAWCGPCKMMAPAYEQASGELEPAVRFAKVDTEAAPELGARYGIRSIPTMVLFQGGKEIARQSGAMGAADIKRWVQTHLKG